MFSTWRIGNKINASNLLESVNFNTLKEQNEFVAING